jgi:hypothetical protein
MKVVRRPLVVIDRIKWLPCAGQRGRLLGMRNKGFEIADFQFSLGPFFGSTRAASILPSRPPNLAAAARRACQGWPRLRGHPKGLALIWP